jgi:hypothetical protein
MKGKIALVAGTAVGYVLGTRAGRERYEQMKGKAQGYWVDHRPQQKASQASDAARNMQPSHAADQHAPSEPPGRPQAAPAAAGGFDG